MPGYLKTVRRVSIVSYTGHNPPDLTALLKSSIDEGHGLVQRTGSEWADGTNTFTAHGEVFFLAMIEDASVGMCGLNVDPFTDDPNVGRIRHLYVLPEHRRNQIGKSLVDACIRHAEDSFERLRLRTFDPVAARFYESIGFVQTNERAATHLLEL